MCNLTITSLGEQQQQIIIKDEERKVQSIELCNNGRKKIKNVMANKMQQKTVIPSKLNIIIRHIR